MTTFRTPGDAADLLRSLRARLDHIERHRHPALEQAVLEEGTRPKPPQDVTYDYILVGGEPAVWTQWDPPTENVDNTPLTDLDHYEVESQVGGELLYDDPTALSPARPNTGLNTLHDTRGTEGIVRGSSGASLRAPDGRDLWLWSDALVGAMDGHGDLLDVDRVHNAASWTLGLAQQQDLVGSSNLLEGLTLQLTGATAASDGTFTSDGYSSTALTATAATVDAWWDIPVAPGQRVLLMAQHQSAGQSIAWEFRDAGALLSGTQTIVAGKNTILTGAAPATASTLRFYVFRATGRTAGQVVSRFVKAGAFLSDHLMMSWRAPASEETYTNVFTNPEGRGITAGTYSQLVSTNLSTNPSFEVNTTGVSLLASATVSRVASGTAFAGSYVARIRRGGAGNATFFRIGTAAVVPGALTARFRVRRAAPLASSTSTLTVVAEALATSTVLATSSAHIIDLTDDWQVVTVTVTGPATTNALRITGSASGTAWVASDLIDVDGVEFYQGSAPAAYFDGSTSPGDGFVHAWTGTAGSSTSTKTATHIRRTNVFPNPRLTSTASTAVVGAATRTAAGNALTVTTTASGQGVRLSPGVSFPGAATVSASVLLRGSGQVRLVINGTPTAQSQILTLSPGEDRRLALTSLLTATSTVTVDVIAQGAASFTLREPIVEQGLGGDYFHGSSTVPDRIAAWAGAVDASASTLAAPTPTSWAPVDATRERLAYDAGAVKVTALKDTATLAARVSSTALTAGTATVTASVDAPAGTTIQIQAVFSNAATAQSPQLLPGEPVRHVFTVPAGATSSTFTVVATGSFAALDSVRVANVTLVQGSYLGAPFTGEMDATEGATAVWSGAVHASTSVLTLDAADQYLDDRPVSLVAATDAGLPPSHFFRPEDTVLLGATAYVFLTGHVRAPSAVDGFDAVRTGKTYLASFDLTTGTYLDVVEWAAPSTGTWGTAVASDGTWLYVYGHQGESVQLARTPIADPLTVTYWDGAAWVASGTPGVVAVGSDGFYGVRLIGTEWVALEIPSPGTSLHKWTAMAPQGPFADVGVQDSWTGIPRTHPRFHPQFDDAGEGIVTSTTDSDGIRFTNGPPGTPHASFDYEIWGDRQSVLTPSHYTLNIERGTPYRVRVRAVAATGRWSDWELGEAQVYWPAEPVVPRPATPTAQVLFRGARIYWPGVDRDGEPYAGFVSYRLHMSTESSFEPGPGNLVATSGVAGGVSYIPVDDYRTYYVVVVVHTTFGVSDPSDPVTFTGERLSDPDLAGVLIDGAKIAKGTLNLESLTVGSFGNSLVPNPGFEVPRPDDATRPVSWTAGHARQPGGGTLTPEQAGDYRLDTSTVLEGGKSLRVDTLAASSVQVVSEPFPITAGDIYYVACRLRTSSLSADVRITFKMGTTVEDVNAEPDTAFSDTVAVYTSTGTFTTVHAEGQVEVPDGDGGSEPMHWGMFSIEALHTGTPYSSWVDSVEVRQIVGTASIANASINNAKIADLAVDDAKISSLSAGKITTGFLSSDRIEAGSLSISKVGGLNAALAAKTTTFAQNDPPSSLNIGDIWIDTNDGNKMYRAASVGTTTIGAGHWEMVAPAAAISTRTFAQAAIPTAVNVGDLWVDTDDDNKFYRAAAIGASTVGPGAWESVAPVTTKTFAQNTVPVAQNIGDLWIDLDNNNEMYRAASVGADQIAAGEWISIEPSVVSTTTFAQDAIPTSLYAGDLWIDTNDANKMYRAAAAGVSTIGPAAWVLIERPTTKTFAQPNIPTSETIGDLWIDTDDNNKMYRAAAAGATTIDAGGWVAVPPVTTKTFAQPAPPTSINIGDLWVDTDDFNKFYRAESIGATTVAAGQWVLVETPSLATFAQPDAPTSVNVGDLWVDTDDGNKMYRSAVAGSATIGAGGWVQVATPTVRTFSQDEIPTSSNAGDLWIDTNDNMKMYRAFAAGVNTIGAAGWVAVAPVSTKTFAQGLPAPVAVTAGDLWVHTGANNRLYRAVVAGADAIAAGEWVEVAQPTSETFAQDAIPTARNIGDLWVDTNDSNKMYRSAAIGANTIGAGAWVLIDNTAFAQAATIVNGWVYTGTTNIDGGVIQTDTIKAGSIQLGVLRSNLIADPSFEEDYTFTIFDPFGGWSGEWQQGNVGQWRRGNASNGGSITRDSSGDYARSGKGALLLTAAASSEAAIISNSFKTTIGKTYRLVVNAASVGAQAQMSPHVMKSSSQLMSALSFETLVGDTSWLLFPPIATVPVSADEMKSYTWTFTATDEWAAVRLINYAPPALATLVLDDISVIEVGIGGASELTSAGLRLFDSNGFESGAFVSNRPNSFTVSRDRVTLASIDSNGDASFGAVSINGRGQSGLTIYGTEFLEHLDRRPRGIVARGSRFTASSAQVQETGYMRLDVNTEAGRQYLLTASGMVGSSQIDGVSRLYVRHTTNGSTPTTASDKLIDNRIFHPTTGYTHFTMSREFGSVTDDRDYRILLSYAGATGSTTVFADAELPVTLVVQDIGPRPEDTGIDLSAGSPPPTSKVYQTFWDASASESYTGANVARGGADNGALIQGYDPDEAAIGDQHGVALFGGLSRGGQTGLTLAQVYAQPGFTLHRADVYLNFHYWHYDQGDAVLRPWKSSTLSGSAPSGTAMVVPNWRRGYGNWIEMTDLWDASSHGIAVGKAGSTDLTKHGRASGAGQQNGPMLGLTYKIHA